METNNGQETVLCFKSEQDKLSLYLTLVRGDLHIVFKTYRDLPVLFVQYIRFGEMLGWISLTVVTGNKKTGKATENDSKASGKNDIQTTLLLDLKFWTFSGFLMHFLA